MEVGYKIGDRFATVTEYGCAVAYEILAIAPELDSDGQRTVFVKETVIPLDCDGFEETTEDRNITYTSYYDYIVVYGDKFIGKEFYSGIVLDS